MNRIEKLLIANRGEIACRIIRSAKKMGIKCAAIYSEADRHARHVQMADLAFSVGPASAQESYLNGSRIVEVASGWQADAIHPGYGFLSENAGFARQVEENDMIFVGPSSTAIAEMGSKARAKELMQTAGVPLLPGFHGESQDANVLFDQAVEIGFPLLIKAVAGGGGKGLRVVHAASEFAESLKTVQREALSAFGDERVLLEKYLQRARHIEIQIFGDSHGNCVHLYERDCSIQRRHQKVIEEAPAPGISQETRQRMGRAATNAARAIHYSGAGTVEFLYQDEKFYFMEMNTRLQVEHPVTEEITGLDLVEWQLRVAQGEVLPRTQEQLDQSGVGGISGWAIEARVNAEAPEFDFRPGTGVISRLVWPAAAAAQATGSVSYPEGSNSRLRIETGIEQQSQVSVFYDSMLAKIIAWAPTRTEAAAALSNALARTHLIGVENNIDFLKDIVDSTAFRNAELHTGFLSDNPIGEAEPDSEQNDFLAGVLCLYCYLSERAAEQDWGALSNWRNLTPYLYQRSFQSWPTLKDEPRPQAFTSSPDSPGHERRAALKIEHNPELCLFIQDGESWEPISARLLASVEQPNEEKADEQLEVYFKDRRLRFTVYSHQHARGILYDIYHPAGHTRFLQAAESESLREADSGQDSLMSPLPGRIAAVNVSAGDSVASGQALLLLDAMKMEHTLAATRDCVVKTVHCVLDDIVEPDQLLVEFADEQESTHAQA